MRKAHPGMGVWNGVRFPREARSGKFIPEYAFRLGCSFPLVLYTESASQFGRPFWDALSVAEDMRPRISCSAYAYACCQVSTSSLAAA